LWITLSKQVLKQANSSHYARARARARARAVS